MKILCCGDLHITNKRPKNRTDDYFSTVTDKLHQIVNIAKDEQCELIVFPGDVFDSAKENHLVVQTLMHMINEINIPVYAVAGQHDMSFHNPDLSGTAFQTLIESSTITLVSDSVSIKNVTVYGANWGKEIPKITNDGSFNILLIHKMVVNDEKLWTAQEGHTWANHIISTSGFDLIISGDNHKQFFAEVNGKHLINLGSMMRSTIAQTDHVPAVAVYDTETKTYEIFDLEIKHFSEIMMVEKAKKEKETSLKIKEFINYFKNIQTGNHGTSTRKMFENHLDSLIKKNNVEPEVIQIIKEVME